MSHIATAIGYFVLQLNQVSIISHNKVITHKVVIIIFHVCQCFIGMNLKRVFCEEVGNNFAVIYAARGSKEVPQPQLRVAFGLVSLKPESAREST